MRDSAASSGRSYVMLGLTGLLVALTVALSGAADAFALSSRPNPGWITDGPVHAVLPVGSRVYIGGDFTYIGPVTGPGVPLQRRTGWAAKRFPKVVGSVSVSVSDGHGGYFIAGYFTKIGGVAQRNLAHIRGDGAVDRAWRPHFGDQAVMTMALRGSTLYLGGGFDRLDGQPRSGLAAINAGTGLLTPWHPQLSTCEGCSLEVDHLASSGHAVYVAGTFESAGGKPSRNGLAAFDIGTGAVTPWRPSWNGSVGALVVSGANVYLAGNREIGDNLLGCVAAFDTGNGHRIWRVNASGSDGYVNALAVSRSTLYVGGSFTRISHHTRHYLAALDRRTGTVTVWNPDVGSFAESPSVYVLNLSGSTLYVGGQFTSIGGRSRTNLAALNAADGRPTGWRPGADSSVLALAASRTTVYAGGDFNSAGGLERHDLAALDARTGVATSWSEDANGDVNALLLHGSTIYVGGSFTKIGARARNYLAALSPNNGALLGWNPNADGAVYALAAQGSRVYVGGHFNRIGGIPRRDIAAVSSVSGAPNSWRPDADGDVHALAVSGSLVYVGGKFTHIGGAARRQVAALYASSGSATPWDPSPRFQGDCNTRFGSSAGCSVGPAVLALATAGRIVYVGGVFTSIGGRAREYLAAIDAESGRAMHWNPGAHTSYDYVDALIISGSTLYAGGDFGAHTISTRTAKSGGWSPSIIGLAAIAVVGPRVYVGADTVYAGRALERRGGFASFGPFAGPAPSHGLG